MMVREADVEPDQLGDLPLVLLTPGGARAIADFDTSGSLSGILLQWESAR